MRSTEIELEKLNKLWATLQTTTMAIDSLTKRAIHDAERKQRRLDEIHNSQKDVSFKERLTASPPLSVGDGRITDTMAVDFESTTTLNEHLRETIDTQEKHINYLRAELDKRKKSLYALEMELRQKSKELTQQAADLGSKLVASQNKYDQIQAQYSNLVRAHNELHTSYTKLFDLYNNFQAEVKTLREAPKPTSNDQLITDIIKLVMAFSTNKIIHRENVHGILTSLLSQGATTRQVLDSLKRIL